MTAKERIRNILMLEEMKKNTDLSARLGLRDISQLQAERKNVSINGISKMKNN